MKPKNVLAGLTYCDEISGKRQTYYVYKGEEHYCVVTYNKNKDAYNFNVVMEEACEYVVKLFAGESKVTSSAVAEESKKPALVGETLEALNVLYVLCATGRAKIDQRFTRGNSLYFNVYKK